MSSDASSSSTSAEAASSAPNGKTTLRVLTLNVWGLKYFSKLRNVRIPAIAARLAASEYDVVALQEIWCESTDWRELRSRCSVTFPHAKFFYTGAFGSGLAILSRFPIIATHTHPFSLNGHPVLVHHGDWIVAKAAGCATIAVPKAGLIDFWVTHTVAAGGEDGPESRRAHRVVQAYELANHARNSASKGRHVVCLGDLNSTPPSLAIAILRDVGLLTDAYLQARPDLQPHAVSLPPTSSRVRPDPRRSISELGVTCDSPLNTWTAGKPLDERALKGAGKRLDYIFFRGPDHLSSKQGRMKCVQAEVSFTELIEGHQCSFSDHFGLEAIFEISQPSHGSETTDGGGGDEEATSRPSQTLTSALSALSAALSASRQTQRTHTFYFIAATILALSCVIFAGSKKMGAKHGLGTLWAFFTLLLTWFATTALYSALIWGEWEKRTLRTFLEAMELDLTHHRARQHPSEQDYMVATEAAQAGKSGRLISVD